jgi:hypothetical protein
MNADNGRIQIEPGYKETYGEAGFSYGNFLGSDTLKFVHGRTYNFERKVDDSGIVNTHIINSAQQVNFYGALLRENHIASTLEVRMAYLQNRLFYDIVAGYGIRLYKGPVAGRIFGLFGLTNVLTDVYVFERNSEGDFDHIDYFNQVKKSVGVSFNCNTTFEHVPVNPFFSINARYYTLFGYKNVYIDLFTCSMMAGAYCVLGQVIPAVGARVNYYYKNKGVMLNPALTGQLTFVIGAQKKLSPVIR